VAKINNDEKRKLLALIQEAKNRGLELPTELFEKPVYNFPTDSRGYFVRADGKLFTPYSDQESFTTNRDYFSGFGGARGSGKSAGGIQKALKKIEEGQSGAIMNPDFENLKISTWEVCREWIPWNMVSPAHRYRRNPEFDPHQPFTLTFLNGVRVTVKGVKDPDSARGPNINWIWFDEAQRDRTGLSWQTAVASVRVGNNPQAWATFTPAGQLHWTYKLFIKKEIPDDAKELFAQVGGDRELVSFYHGTIFDNQANLDPGFMAAMLAAYPSGWLRKQEIFGEFVNQEGAIGDRTWFDGKVIVQVPDGITAKVRFWDLAATEKKVGGKKATDPDETVGTLMSTDKSYFYVENQVHGCWKWDDIKNTIYETALQDGARVKIYIEQEPAAGGKNQIEELKSFIHQKLPGHSLIEGWRPPTDRLTCANTWFAEAAKGLIFLVAGDWVEPMLQQLSVFPDPLLHDDKITSISGARYCLAPIKNWTKMSFMHL
jgi:predicted phage terminase large subunit-like protein